MDPNTAHDYVNDTDGDLVREGEEALDGTDLNDADDYLDAVDRTQGTNGLMSFMFDPTGAYDENYPNVIGQNSAGQIFLGGELGGDESGLFLARFTEDWQLDTDFSDDGYFVGPDYSINGETIHSLDVNNPDEALLLVDSCSSDMCFVAINESGELDTSRFSLQSQQGVYEFSLNVRGTARSLALAADNYLVANPTTGANGSTRVVKLNSDETIDSTFNSNVGFINYNMLGGYGSESPTGIWYTLDGDIMLAMRASISTGQAIYLAKFDSDGNADSEWGDSGVLEISSSEGYRDLRFLVGETSGYWVLATLGTNANKGIALLRLDDNGSLDTSFGTDGRVVFENHSNGYYNNSHFEVQADGRIIVISAIETPDADSAIMIARITSNGELDSTFYGNGTARFIVGSSDAYVSAVTVLNNHDIAITGSLYNDLDDTLGTYIFVVPNESDIDSDGIEDHLDDVNDLLEVDEPEEEIVEELDDTETEETKTNQTSTGGSLPYSIMFVLWALVSLRQRDSRKA
jgi:uncharacterized delta-60 repeat protein